MKVEGGLIIHLTRAAARRPGVDRLLRELPLPMQVLEAVDGRTAAPEDLAAYDRALALAPRFPFPLLSAEVACFLSHRAAWARIVSAGWEAGLVLEDDAAVDAQALTRALALAAAHPGDGIVQLQTRDPGPARVVAQEEEMRVLAPVLAPLRATCSLYTRAACLRLLEITESFDRPVDVLLQMQWVTGIAPRVVWPSGVSEASANVGGTTIQKKNRGILDRVNREIRRPLFRAAMRRRASRG